MTRPTSSRCQLWWRNDQDRFRLPFADRVFEGVPIPEAPAGLVMAQGAGDNRLYIWPSEGLVVARRGGPAFEAGAGVSGRGFDREFWHLLMPCRA